MKKHLKKHLIDTTFVRRFADLIYGHEKAITIRCEILRATRTRQQPKADVTRFKTAIDKIAKDGLWEAVSTGQVTSQTLSEIWKDAEALEMLSDAIRRVMNEALGDTTETDQPKHPKTIEITPFAAQRIVQSLSPPKKRKRRSPIKV